MPQLKTSLGLLLTVFLVGGLGYYLSKAYTTSQYSTSLGEAGPSCDDSPATNAGSLTSSPNEEASECLVDENTADDSPGEQALLREAMAFLAKRQPDAALVKFEELIRHNPNHAGALIEIGMIYQLDKKEPRLALPYYQRAYALQLDNNILLSELVGIYAELNDMRNGVNALKEIARQNPQQTNLAMVIGKILVSNDLMSEALPYLETAVKQEPYDMALPDLGFAYARMGEKDRARQAFQAAIGEEQERYRQGVYQNKEAEGRRNIMLAYMNYASELFLQDDKEKAARIIKDKIQKIPTLPFQDIDDIF